MQQIQATEQQLNTEIKNHFNEKKRRHVRRNIYPGNTASLWKAVKK